MCLFCLASMGLIVASATSAGGLTTLAVKLSRKKSNPKGRTKLLGRGKQLTHKSDDIAAGRCQLPWLSVEKNYIFDSPEEKGREHSSRPRVPIDFPGLGPRRRHGVRVRFRGLRAAARCLSTKHSLVGTAFCIPTRFKPRHPRRKRIRRDKAQRLLSCFLTSIARV